MSKGSICHLTSVHKDSDVRILHRECVTLVRTGYEVHLVVLNGEHKTVDGVHIHGVEVKKSSRLNRITAAQRAIYKAVVDTGATIFHLHDPELLRLTGRLKKLGAKVIYDAHEDLPRQMLTKAWVPSIIAPVSAGMVERWEDKKVVQVDAVVAATDHIADRFRPLNRVFVVKNYPLIPEYKPPEQDKRARQLCYAGGITVARGVKEMITASDKAGIPLHIAGPIDPHDLADDLKKMSGWKNVNYHGFVDKLAVEQLIRQSMAGLVVLHDLPGYREALPVKMFEYMAGGTPVIASDFPLWRSIITSASAGMLVPPGDVASLTQAIQYLAAHPEEAAEMGRNGYNAVMEKYNWNMASQALINCYESL